MTAEEFFRKKIKEKYPHQEVVTLADNLITAEDGMRWAYEFSQLPQQEISDEEIEKVSATLDYDHISEIVMWEKGARWYREQLKNKSNG